MATPRQLRVQDRLLRQQGRATRLQALLDRQVGTPAAAAAAQRLFRTQQRIAGTQYRQDILGTRAPGYAAPAGSSLTQEQLLAQQRANEARLAAAQAYQQRLRRPARQARVQNRITQLQQQQQQTANALNALQTVPGAPPPPAAGPTAPTGQSQAPTTPPGTLQDLLPYYTAPPAPGSDVAQNFFQQGLSRLNMSTQPSFEDQFARWLTVANREANRNAAAINEAFGSRGARYGSDLLRAQGDLRQRLQQDIGTQADQINASINQQRLAELGGLAGLYQPFAQMQNQANQNALAYLFSDATRQTAPSPLLAGAGQYATAYGGPTTIVQ